MAKTDEVFVSELRAEIAAAQERRGKLGLAKLSFIVALLGFGSTTVGSGDATSLLLYLIPFVGLIFDLYILGEHFGIKRAGEFLRTSSAVSEEEAAWETAMFRKRDLFSYAASVISSAVVVAVAAFAVLWKQGGISKVGLLYWIWLSLGLLFIFFTGASNLLVKRGLTGFRSELERMDRGSQVDTKKP